MIVSDTVMGKEVRYEVTKDYKRFHTEAGVIKCSGARRPLLRKVITHHLGGKVDWN